MDHINYPDRYMQRLCARTLLTGRPKALREFARLWRLAVGHGEAGGWLFTREGQAVAQGYPAYFEARFGPRMFATTDGERAFLNDAGIRMFEQMLRSRLRLPGKPVDDQINRAFGRTFHRPSAQDRPLSGGFG